VAASGRRCSGAGGATGTGGGRRNGDGRRTALRRRGRRGGRRSGAVAGGAPGAVAGDRRAPRPRGGWPGRVWAASGAGVSPTVAMAAWLGKREAERK
jgi:hypothetical protein